MLATRQTRFGRVHYILIVPCMVSRGAPHFVRTIRQRLMVVIAHCETHPCVMNKHGLRLLTPCPLGLFLLETCRTCRAKIRDEAEPASLVLVCILLVVLLNPRYRGKMFSHPGADLVYKKKISLLDALQGFERMLTLLDGSRVRIIHDEVPDPLATIDRWSIVTKLIPPRTLCTRLVSRIPCSLCSSRLSLSSRGNHTH